MKLYLSQSELKPKKNDSMNTPQKKILVTGSSGFIGGHLVRLLKSQGHLVVGADIEQPKYEKPHLFYNFDLREQGLCRRIFFDNKHFDEVYNLACLMGGMGYIGDKSHSYDIMVGSSQIVANIIECCVEWKVKKSFYSSSACVYNMHLQETEGNCSLKESDSYPAMPDLMYGWQKLFSEQMYQAAKEQHGLDIRIARFHNIFGHEGTWDGGKEKAPAALSRKIAYAKDFDTIEVWGTGNQVRSFMFVEECIEAVMRLMDSDCDEPINIGSDEWITINDLALLIADIADKHITIKNDLTKPQGVAGRNSDNTMIEQKLGWKPSRSLRSGLEITYNWINQQANQNTTNGKES
jgi:GDP-D-mannose 3',5'-epimerase